MLTHHRKLVSLSWISTDLPIRSVLETVATIERKDSERFSLLLTEPIPSQEHSPLPIAKNPVLLWIEISPYRITITRQAVGQLNYRHFWEPGVYGVSRYWLNNSLQNSEQLQLRNFTRRLTLAGHPLPQRLRLEYELWSGKEQLGNYVLKLEIHF